MLIYSLQQKDVGNNTEEVLVKFDGEDPSHVTISVPDLLSAPRRASVVELFELYGRDMWAWL